MTAMLDKYRKSDLGLVTGAIATNQAWSMNRSPDNPFFLPTTCAVPLFPPIMTSVDAATLAVPPSSLTTAESLHAEVQSFRMQIHLGPRMNLLRVFDQGGLKYTATVRNSGSHECQLYRCNRNISLPD